MHPGNVPERLAGQYKAVYENAADVPIVDRHVMDVFNGKNPKARKRQNSCEFSIGAINADPFDTDYVPALATNLADWPRAYFVACGLDPMRDDAIIIESELKKAGVKTKIDVYPGLPHIFWVFDGLPSTKQFYQNMVKGIEFVLAEE